MKPPPSPRALPGLLRLPYALYAGLLFVVLALAVLVVILPMPGLRARRTTTRFASRIFLAAAGMRLTCTTPPTAAARLCGRGKPRELSGWRRAVCRVAATLRLRDQAEMSRVPLANLLLRRIGAHYVDRGQGHKGA